MGSSLVLKVFPRELAKVSLEWAIRCGTYSSGTLTELPD